MSKIDFIYKFHFVDEDGETFVVEFTRRVSDEFSAASYAFDWLNTFHDDSEFCILINVYEYDNPNNIILNVMR